MHPKRSPPLKRCAEVHAEWSVRSAAGSSGGPGWLECSQQKQNWTGFCLFRNSQRSLSKQSISRPWSAPLSLVASLNSSIKQSVWAASITASLSPTHIYTHTNTAPSSQLPPAYIHTQCLKCAIGPLKITIDFNDPIPSTCVQPTSWVLHPSNPKWSSINLRYEALNYSHFYVLSTSFSFGTLSFWKACTIQSSFHWCWRYK